MSRKSPEARAAATIMSKRPPPPASMPPAAAKLWMTILAERAPGYFDAGNLPLLAQYCRLLVVLDGTDIGTTTHKRLLGCVTTLATKLRLTVQSNTHRRAGILDERVTPAPLLGGKVSAFRKPPGNAT